MYCTVTSAPFVTGSVFIRRLILFLGLCIHTYSAEKKIILPKLIKSGLRDYSNNTSLVQLCTHFRDECVFMERVGYMSKLLVFLPTYIQWMLWTQWESECYLTWKLFWEIVRFYEQNSKQLFLIFSLSLFLVRGVSPLYSITRGPCNAL